MQTVHVQRPRSCAVRKLGFRAVGSGYGFKIVAEPPSLPVKVPSMEAHFLCRLDRSCAVMELFHTKREERQQPFSAKLKTTQFLATGRIEQVLPAIRCASRATRQGLAVGTTRVMLHGLCTSNRFHTDFVGQGYRLGCFEQPDLLRHYTRCPRHASILCSSGGTQVLACVLTFFCTT